MTRRPAAPANLRNGLKWRDGRPRWEPSPANRTCGFKGLDLRDASGGWMDRGAAVTAADARTLWASIVRAALQNEAARADLSRALLLLPAVEPGTDAAHQRAMVADLIERGRAVVEDRDPIPVAAGGAPRSCRAMVEGFFADARALSKIELSTQSTYRVQSRKFLARFGDDRVDAVRPSMLADWYEDLVDDISAHTANVALGAAGAFFRWAVRQEWIRFSPTEGVERVSAAGRLVFWTLEEEAAFVPWCDANGFADVADCAVGGLWTGARQSDLCRAALEDLSGDTWRYLPKKTRKTGLEALPGILAPLRARVEGRRRRALASPLRPLDGRTPFLVRPDGGVHDGQSIGARFREARAAAVAAGKVPAGFAGKRLQDTRDTCVTRLYDADVSLAKIGSWGGWSKPERILRQHYLNLRDEAAIEDAAKLRAWAERNGVDFAAA